MFCRFLNTPLIMKLTNDIIGNKAKGRISKQVLIRAHTRVNFQRFFQWVYFNLVTLQGIEVNEFA